jgi:hypothetical protein
LPRIYLISRDGGQPEPLSPPEKGQVWDPCWLPDGKTLIWGRIDGGGIRALNLETRRPSVLPRSDDLWYPKCSPLGILLGVKGGSGAAWAHAEHKDGLALLERVFGEAAARKVERVVERRIKDSGLRTRKTLEGFDWAFQPKLDRALMSGPHPHSGRGRLWP